MKPKKTKGFTLIELLVVIAIIGLLSSVVLIAMGGSRKKARDAKRQSDIRQISVAMEMCAQDTACSSEDQYRAVTVDANNRVTSTIGTYMLTMPQDPGGGSGSCRINDTNELASPGGYCAWATGAGSDYCIYAKLSTGSWIMASEKGVFTSATYPASAAACP